MVLHSKSGTVAPKILEALPCLQFPVMLGGDLMLSITKELSIAQRASATAAMREADLAKISYPKTFRCTERAVYCWSLFPVTESERVVSRDWRCRRRLAERSNVTADRLTPGGRGVGGCPRRVRNTFLRPREARSAPDSRVCGL